MLPILIPIATMLAEKGFNLLANAVTAKGQEFVEEKLGIKLDEPKTPEDMLKLKQLEMDHEEFLLELGVRQSEINLEEYKAGLASDADARNMQNTALKQDDIFSKRFLYYFAMAWCGFAALYIVGITFVPMPTSSIRFADTILGFLLGTVVSQIIAFFFGSSHRSAKKDETIAQLSGSQK